MSEYLIQGETLTNIANAIREKKGTSDVILVSAFADEISTIETGGGGGGGNMLTANTEEEMLALITEENIGQFIYYNGVTGTYVNGEYYKVVADDTPDARYCQLYDLPYSATASDIAVGKQAFNGKGGLITGTGVMSGFSTKMSYAIGIQDSIYSSYALSAEDFLGATGIKEYTFYRCYGLTELDLPLTCKSLGSFAFAYCSQLTILDAGGVEQIGQYCFASCTLLSKASLPNVTHISGSAFYLCSGLSIVDAPELVVGENYAFYNCSLLATINAPNTEYIGSYFACSTNLVSIDFPKVSFIGNNAFSSCQKLLVANIPSAEVLSQGAFSNCRSLNSVVMSNVKSIGNSAFFRCDSLTSIVIPSTCEYIGSSAFSIYVSHIIRIEATTPPKIFANTFYTAYLSELQVPPNCLESYQTASFWSAYSSKMVEY